MIITEKVKESALIAIAATAETEFLVDLFKAFIESAIDYCVLRNFAGLPYDLRGSDLDILIAKKSLERARELVKAIAHNHNGFAIWRQLNDYNCAYFHCWGINDDGSRWGVHIDLMIAIRWHGVEYYPSSQVLLRAVKKGNVYIADECDAALVGFLGLLLHSFSGHKYRQSALAAYLSMPKTSKKELGAAFGKTPESFQKILEIEDPEVLKNLTRKLRRDLLIRQIFKSPLKVISNKVNRFRVHCQRLRKRMGIMVVVLGLDGAGKSTLIEYACREFYRLLDTQPEQRHIRPGFLPPLARLIGRGKASVGPVTNPHAKLPSGIFLSILRLSYYTLDFALGFWLTVYPLLVKRGTVVFFDRYYYDYYIDPYRYRISTPEWTVRFFESFIPKPDLVILLIPDPDTYYRRKPELPLGELRRQATRMEGFGRRLHNVVWIKTTGPVEKSREEMMQAVLNTFAGRASWRS